VATLRLFASARDAAGTGRDEVEGATVAAVLDRARDRYGSEFAAVLERSRVWLNGEPVDPLTPVGAGDEVAVLPPVSGGAEPVGVGGRTRAGERRAPGLPGAERGGIRLRDPEHRGEGR
jgi:molybdopterin converting factor small subunit